MLCKASGVYPVAVLAKMTDKTPALGMCVNQTVEEPSVPEGVNLDRGISQRVSFRLNVKCVM